MTLFFWQQLLPLSHQKSFAAPFFISLGHRFYAEVFPVTIFQLQAMLILGQKSLPWHVMPACTKYAYHLGKRQSWYGAMSRISLATTWLLQQKVKNFCFETLLRLWNVADFAHTHWTERTHSHGFLFSLCNPFLGKKTICMCIGVEIMILLSTPTEWTRLAF